MQPGKTPKPNQRAGGFDAKVEQLRHEIRDRVGERRYEMWLANHISLAIHENRVAVGVGSPFLQTWLMRQFRADFLAAAQCLVGPAATIDVVVDSKLTRELVVTDAPSRSALDNVQSPTAEMSRSEPRSISETRSLTEAANPSAVVVSSSSRGGRRLAALDEFMVSEGNEVAVASAREVVRRPGDTYRLLYLHGPVGCGKTHLLEGIRRGLQEQHGTRTSVLLTAEAFANYFTVALGERTLPAFRQRFRTVDVLLVDDIDFFEGKRAFQEEFLHTVADLIDHGRQVVLTGDRHPRLMTRLPEELVSRIQSGMIGRLEAPDEATRRDIVRQLARRVEGEFTDEALNYVAQKFKHNVRELEGAMNCLQTAGTVSRKPVTLALARRVLAELERDCLRIVRLADIERVVCDLFGVKPVELKSDSRSRTVSQPRMLAMYLARKHTQAAYQEIGKHFGNRNHSTVMSAERKVEGWVQSSAELRVCSQVWRVPELLDTLEQRLLAG
ncbi:MAG: chromosomal replication initiator protein DnaA [Planctomycetaceae bacterium]|nr:chromosomal replication initiator protein DnaA [Planctomycetaceae bacterium]